MWRVVFASALGAAALAGGATAQDVHARTDCGDFRGTAASCAERMRRQTLADAFAPRPLDMNSYVRRGSRALTLSAVSEAQDQAELAGRINAELAVGRCDAARELALDHGFHSAAARIRRACVSAR